MANMATSAKRATPAAAAAPKKTTTAAQAPAKTARAAATKTAPAARTRRPAPPAERPADAPPTVPAGWYPTATDPTQKRYWDGQAWLGEALPADMVPADDVPADETADDDDADQLVIDPITFRGRTMAVNPLDAGKLGVWQIIVDEFNDAADGPPAGASASMVKAHTTKLARLLKQGIKVIRSVLADERDREWLVDQLMESDLTLLQAAQIVTLAVEAFVKAKAKGGAEQAAPRTGPTPRVRRG
jgi:hypothetical protein